MTFWAARARSPARSRGQEGLNGATRALCLCLRLGNCFGAGDARADGMLGGEGLLRGKAERAKEPRWPFTLPAPLRAALPHHARATPTLNIRLASPLPKRNGCIAKDTAHQSLGGFIVKKQRQGGSPVTHLPPSSLVGPSD